MAAIDNIWKDKPNYVRKYIDSIDSYEKLCEEVAYILEIEANKTDIEFSSLTYRVKTLNSFCEKIERKNYQDPFSEIQDLSGIRLVHHYYSDQKKKIEKIIEDQFDIIDKVDRTADNEADVFGYNAIHYIAKLKKKHSGPRYDDLKNLVCEIQVRTILQDAWAIIAHHLAYKSTQDIPKQLQRKLNALSGLFETADDQFENIRKTRADYQENLKNEINQDKKNILEKNLNLDNLKAYLEWKLPKRAKGDFEDVSQLLLDLKEEEYKNIWEIEDLVNKYYKALEIYEKASPPSGRDKTSDEIIKTNYIDVGVIRTILNIKNNVHGLADTYEKHIK